MYTPLPLLLSRCALYGASQPQDLGDGVHLGKLRAGDAFAVVAVEEDVVLSCQRSFLGCEPLQDILSNGEHGVSAVAVAGVDGGGVDIQVEDLGGDFGSDLTVEVEGSSHFSVLSFFVCSLS